jgi:hypothetical protein
MGSVISYDDLRRMSFGINRYLDSIRDKAGSHEESRIFLGFSSSVKKVGGISLGREYVISVMYKGREVSNIITGDMDSAPELLVEKFIELTHDEDFIKEAVYGNSNE